MTSLNKHVDCDELRELLRDYPEPAVVIIAMLREAGEDCGLDADAAVQPD